jgi:guanosine-3',5'-bis(diphosphate) 3'-pyrophosphohydrolase
MLMGSKLHNLESIRRCPPVGWTARRVQAYFVWAKQVTDSE